MGSNTHPRAHVASPTGTSAAIDLANREFADLDFEKCTTSDDEAEDETADATQSLGRKKQITQSRQRASSISSNERSIESSLKSRPTSARTSIDTQTSDDANNSSQRLSRRERRKSKKLEAQLDSPLAPALQPVKPPNNPPKRKPAPITNTALTISPTPAMPPTQYFPLLVCSLGNPGKQYANTLHSAGHMVLDTIRARGQYLPFSKGMSGLYSTPDMTRSKLHLLWGSVKEQATELAPGEDNFTLWQSTKLMNVSGPPVKSAWQTFSAQMKARGTQGRLVIMHDELEASLGQVNIRSGTASPKGHNGVKSCQNSLQNVQFWRVGIGIGRPESRDPVVVSKHVLRKMTVREEQAMLDSSFHALKALRLIAEGNA